MHEGKTKALPEWLINTSPRTKIWLNFALGPGAVITCMALFSVSPTELRSGELWCDAIRKMRDLFTSIEQRRSYVEV